MGNGDYHCTKETDIEDIKKRVSRIEFIEELLKEARKDIKSLLISRGETDGGKKTLQMWTVILVPCILTFALSLMFHFIEKGIK